MSTIVTRSGKGSPLTHTELDANFTNLNTDKAGYITGEGGVVTQATSKSTGVTLSKRCGEITLNNAALAASTTVTFTLTNTTIGASDLLVMNHASAGTAGAYALTAQCSSGSASISVRNITAGSLSEAIVIRFAVIKGAIS
jgi:hypothetical protein